MNVSFKTQDTQINGHDINIVYIPFTLAGRLISIQATVDGISGTFFFDTGAERLLLNRNYFSDGTIEVQAAIGNAGTVSDVTQRDCDTVTLEQFVVTDVLAHVVDLSAIENKKNIQLRGILGYNVFNNFEVEIDFSSQVLVLRKVDKKGNCLEQRPKWDQPVDSLDFVLKKHLISLPVTVGGKKLNFCLDTGAEVNLLDRLVGRKVLSHFTILKRVNIVGVGDGKLEVLAGILSGIKCGNLELNEMPTLLTNLDDINNTFRTNLHGVLGFEFFSGARTVINYQKEKLYFLKTARP